MVIDSITARALHIPFKVAFVHASASRAATQSIWVNVSAQGGAAGVGEGCPREYVTGESVATALAFVAAHRRDLQASIRDVATLARWVELHRSEIDAHPAAWAAVELALLDLIGQEEGRTVESLFGLPMLAGRFRYTAILGDAAPAAFEAQLGTYVDAGFRDFKVKLCGDVERDRAKVRALRAAGISETAVRADANNVWADADRAVRYLDALDFRFWALEEPLRAGDFAGMRRMSQALDTRIILDESLLRAEQLDEIRADAHRWIANVRVSKMGGLLRSLQFGVEARAQRRTDHRRSARWRNERAHTRRAGPDEQHARSRRRVRRRIRDAFAGARCCRAFDHVWPGRHRRCCGAGNRRGARVRTGD